MAKSHKSYSVRTSEIDGLGKARYEDADRHGWKKIRNLNIDAIDPDNGEPDPDFIFAKDEEPHKADTEAAS